MCGVCANKPRPLLHTIRGSDVLLHYIMSYEVIVVVGNPPFCSENRCCEKLITSAFSVCVTHSCWWL